jgi:PTS system nitrogen regulatory IIA component
VRLVDILSEDLVVASLRSRDRDGVLGEIADHVAKRHGDVDRDLAKRVLYDRECIGSTGIGQGIAIPHAKLPRIKTLIACFARSVEGVEFGSLDSKPAHLFLTLLAPEGQAGIHLKALARVSRLFKDPGFRARLMDPADAHGLFGIISSEDARLARGE